VTFEWDDGKAEANLKKHRVAFEDASTVFFDPLAMTFPDPDHSLDERHYRRATAGTNLVLIEPDLASIFPDSEAVNRALRVLAEAARTASASKRRRPRLS